MDIIIRSACTADVPAMHRIRMGVRENRLGDPARASEASYLPYVAAGSAWVAEGGTGIVGFAVLNPETENMWALFVDEAVEGLGVGRALHERMLDWAREQGMRKLWLSTAPGTRAERFYVAAGWTQVGVTNEGEARFKKSLADRACLERDEKRA